MAIYVAAGSLAANFATSPLHDVAGTGDFSHALGYSYSEDPNFMYCAEDMTINGSANWWLPACGLSGGSSGGPWVQPLDVEAGSGPIVSVNSWGYINLPGMAGSKLSGTSAACVFAVAKTVDLPGRKPLDGTAGTAAVCP